MSITKPTNPRRNNKASVFLEHVFIALDDSKIKYCVERNYDQYPSVISGDVDLVVASADLNSTQNLIVSVADKLLWKPFVVYSSLQAVHLGFYCDVSPERFVLVIELFAGGVWRGLEYITAENILKLRDRHGCTWKPHTSHEAIITLIHHLLYNRCVFDKYKKQVKLCAALDKEKFKSEMAIHLGEKWAKYIASCVQRGKWDELEAQADKIRRFFVLRSLCLNPFRFFYRILNLFACIKCKPEGVAISLDSSSVNKADQMADAIIKLAVQWHIFIPPVRKKIHLTNSYSDISKEVKSIVNSGGVAVIVNKTREPFSVPKFVNPIIKVDVTSDVARISIGNKMTLCKINSDTFAHDIWNVILKYRVENLGRD